MRRVPFQAAWEVDQYANLRFHTTTLHDLKVVAALAHESMIDTVTRLVAQEKERFQREERKDAKKSLYVSPDSHP